MSEFVAGQRWINDAELSLGLGTVLAVEHRTVSFIFHASGESRTYAKDSAQLTRILFKAGDKITDIHKRSLVVEAVEDQGGVMLYHVKTPEGQLETLEERDLDTAIQLNQALDRLMSGQIDHNKWYRLRQSAWHNLLKNHNSGIQGLTGARTSLIPHQLYIAQEVATRYAPRVLLADEVGLGKTIEAGMILHHQLITGRASRVLIIVPEALIHQWLVELLRRFNLFFSIFDEERCQAIIESSEFDNPFMAEQFVLCSLNLMTDNPDRFDQLLAADWDLLIVDEAHHLEWQEQQASEEYQLVEALSKKSKGLLLLTATPEQFGKQSHFARLRLLDADRFNQYDNFLKQEQQYQKIADLIDCIQDQDSLSKDNQYEISQYLKNIDTAELQQSPLSEAFKQKLINQLLDCHGTGRVLFRNSRAAIQGFPERKLLPHPLPLAEIYKPLFDTYTDDIESLLHPEQSLKKKIDWYKSDSRIEWLASLLKQLVNEKILLITHHAQSAADIALALKTQHGIAASVFHEDLSIVERDKRAADFADKETGVQILLCSEIGSEGRNFQFCHHIVLFDLPYNPDLLEQRIGRLDRIGQTQTIKIHVPYFENTCQERLYQWYHESLNAFNSTCPAGAQLFNQHQHRLPKQLQASESSDAEFSEFLKTCHQQYEALNTALHEGRDRLLEYSSCRLDIAEKLVKRIEYFEHSSELKSFMSTLFDCYGVNMEENKPGSYIINPAEHMIGHFPGLDDDGMTITFEREVALIHDDMHFLSWDHPMVLNSIDMLLGNELGNTSVCSSKIAGSPPGQLIIQLNYIIDIEISSEYQELISRQQCTPLSIELSFNEQAIELDNTGASTINSKAVKSIDKKIAKQIINLKQVEIQKAIDAAQSILQNDMQGYMQTHYSMQILTLENEVE